MNQLSYLSSTPYATLHRLSKSNQQRVDLDVLSRICVALNIQPGELLIETEVEVRRRK